MRRLTVKKFSSCVRPGVLLANANLRRLVRTLITLDLPALDRPTNATSGSRARRAELICSSSATDNANCALSNAAAALGGRFADRTVLVDRVDEDTSVEYAAAVGRGAPR